MCSHIDVWGKIEYCDAYANPEMKWIVARCPGATHITEKITEKKRTMDPRKLAKQRKAGLVE